MMTGGAVQRRAAAAVMDALRERGDGPLAELLGDGPDRGDARVPPPADLPARRERARATRT